MIGNAIGPGATVGLLGAQLNSSVQEDLFVQGKSFSFEDYFTFAADETKTFVFSPLAFEGVNITVNPFIFSATSGPCEIDLYYGTTNDEDGTLLGASNRRFGMPAPKSTLRLNPSNVILGTRFAGDLIPATGVNPNNSNPATSPIGLPFELSRLIKYALTIHNSDGDGVKLMFKMTWFEV